jgi:hypothetical protein
MTVNTTGQSVPHERIVNRLRRRLGIHRRRMRYWANLPGFYGPTGQRLRDADFEYEIACCDARAVADEIERLTGDSVEVIDVRETFREKWSNPHGETKFL